MSKKSQVTQPELIMEPTTPAALETAPGNPLALLDKAVAANADIDKLEKLMGLYERWEKTQARKAFFEALSLFQSKVSVITKNRKVDYAPRSGGRVTYNFATLDQIIADIQAPLRECGLSYRWSNNESDGRISVSCILAHRDGHEEVTTFSAPADTSGSKNEIQARGSTLTYLRRYTLTGILGIGTAEDDVDARKKSDGQLDPELLRRIAVCNSRDDLAVLAELESDLAGNPEFKRALNNRLEEIKKKAANPYPEQK